ncbi:MAG: hypothetical protein EBV53_03960 [Proteobacteria bacterium]|nr:hypothetical protein [Pseudomonadota bacterium]
MVAVLGGGSGILGGHGHVGNRFVRNHREIHRHCREHQCGVCRGQPERHQLTDGLPNGDGDEDDDPDKDSGIRDRDVHDDQHANPDGDHYADTHAGLYLYADEDHDGSSDPNDHADGDDHADHHHDTDDHADEDDDGGSVGDSSRVADAIEDGHDNPHGDPDPDDHPDAIEDVHKDRDANEDDDAYRDADADRDAIASQSPYVRKHLATVRCGQGQALADRARLTWRLATERPRCPGIQAGMVRRLDWCPA